MCMWVFWSDAGVKVKVCGGDFVATNSQMASHESGMPFESLST